uniref:Calbindin-32 n=1 Tax=Macrostomum lignano TaxID=282301 RepID=A0A1I8GSH0_9PLAT
LISAEPVCRTCAMATASNFLQKFRDKDTRAFKNFTASQFLEVWSHYDLDGSGYIEDRELDSFLREFVSSIVPGRIGEEVVSDSALQDLKEEFMRAYDENEDNKIEIGELAQMLPTEENFLLLFRRSNPLSSSVEFIRVWRQFDRDSSGHIDADELGDFLRHILGEKRDLQLSELARLLPVKDNFLAKPLLKNASRLSGPEIDRLFRKYDMDRSGQIEGDELAGLLKDLLELTGEDYDESKMLYFRDVIMEQWDADKDGRIARDELKMILLQHKRLAEEQEALQSGCD